MLLGPEHGPYDLGVPDAHHVIAGHIQGERAALRVAQSVIRAAFLDGADDEGIARCQPYPHLTPAQADFVHQALNPPSHTPAAGETP